MSATKPILLTLLAMALHFSVYGQLFSNNLRKANKQYELHAYNLAIDSYQKVLERRPNETEALAKIADSYRHLNQMLDAAKYYARAMAQEDVEPAYKLQYGHVLKALGQYEDARRWYLEYAQENPGEGNHYAQSCNFALAQQNTPATYQVTNEFINSSASEFGPAFRGDNQVVFSSARRDIQRSSAGWSGQANNQLFIARIGTNGFLESPYFLKSDLKNAYNEGPVAYSPNENRVAYTKNNFVDGTRHIPTSGMELSLQIADVISTGNWSNDEPFEYNGTDFSVGYPSFSPDGNALYFASNRVDGFGGYDIYVCYRVGNGNNWSTPQNLGPVVNSPGNEVTPFYDGEQLYFASDWHEGFGGYDVFRAEQSNNRWVRIFHMGNGINSPRDDYGFIYDDFENIGYLVSNRPGGRGNEDIYKVSKSADEVVIRIKNAANGRPIPNAVVDFAACGEGEFQANANGVYTFQAVQGLDCNILIRKDGYISQSVRVATTSIGEQQRQYEVMLPRIGEEYSGRVVNYTTRIPLEGATITATNQTTGTDVTVRTDANGDYMLALSPNTTYIIRYSRPGFRDLNRTVRASGDYDRDVLGVISMIPVNADVPIRDDLGVRDPFAEEGTGTTRISRGFAVQVAALSKPNLDGFPDLKNFGTLYSKQVGSTYKIRVGTYDSREEAERILGLVKNQGYRGAFIVEESGEQVSTGTSDDLVPKTPEPGASTGRYKIQLAAYSNVRNFDPSGIRGLGTIEEIQKGRLTVKLLAGFDSVQEARQVLREVKAAGFTDAYVVEDVNGTMKRVR